MTTDFLLTTALETLVALAILSLLLFKLVPEYRLDAFRQKMFTQRDRLWDYAAAGRISFDDPAYLLLRKLMNGFIRYGHQLSFFRVFMTTLHWHAVGHAPELTWHTKWNRALSKVKDPDARAYLEDAHQRALTAMVKHLATGSPILSMFLVGFALGFTAQVRITSLRQRLESSGLMTLARIGVDPDFIEENAAHYGQSQRQSLLTVG